MAVVTNADWRSSTSTSTTTKGSPPMPRDDGVLPFHGEVAVASWLRGPRAPRLPYRMVSWAILHSSCGYENLTGEGDWPLLNRCMG
ncbi:unnamed protein product [Urochloa humidicola]